MENLSQRDFGFAVKLT